MVRDDNVGKLRVCWSRLCSDRVVGFGCDDDGGSISGFLASGSVSNSVIVETSGGSDNTLGDLVSDRILAGGVIRRALADSNRRLRIAPMPLVLDSG